MTNNFNYIQVQTLNVKHLKIVVEKNWFSKCHSKYESKGKDELAMTFQFVARTGALDGASILSRMNG